MSYDLVITVFLMLVFCLLTQLITIKVMLTLFRAKGEEITPIKLFERPKKRTIDKQAAEEQRRFDTIMRNLDAYDGTGIGQEEVR